MTSEDPVRSWRVAVDGMTCAHCEGRVRDAALATPGVTGATADAQQGALIVTVDPAGFRMGDLVKAVAEAGYKPGEVAEYDAETEQPEAGSAGASAEQTGTACPVDADAVVAALEASAPPVEREATTGSGAGAPGAPQLAHADFAVSGMSCAACATVIE